MECPLGRELMQLPVGRDFPQVDIDTGREVTNCKKGQKSNRTEECDNCRQSPKFPGFATPRQDQSKRRPRKNADVGNMEVEGVHDFVRQAVDELMMHE